MTSTAAESATITSRATYSDNLVGRPQVPARAGRKTTLGQLETLISWQVDQYGMVRFDRAALDEAAWYWVILEIGTGKSATMITSTTGGSEQLTIPSQRGRELPRGFYWGNAGGEPADAPGLHNLFPYMDGAAITGYASVLDDRGNPIRIKREIKGKNFVRDGGRAGFSELSRGLTAEWRKLVIP